jgi:hypothetical protein
MTGNLRKNNGNKMKHRTLIAFIDKIARNLYWGLFIAIGFSVVSSIFAFRYISKLEDNFQLMYDKDVIGQNSIQTARIKLLLIDNGLKNIFLNKEPKIHKVFLEKLSKHKKDLELVLRNLSNLFYTKEGLKLYRFAHDEFQVYLSSLNVLTENYSQNKDDFSKIMVYEEVNDSFIRIDALLKQLENIKFNNNKRIFQKIKFQLELSLTVTVILLVLSIPIRIYVHFRKVNEVNESM